MARTVTITFDNGTQHVYQSVPESIEPAQIQHRAETEFGGKVVKLDGGRGMEKGPPDAIDQGAMNFEKDMPWYQQGAAGVGKAISDTGTGLSQIGAGVADLIVPRGTGVPSRVDEMRQQVAETRQRDAPLMNTGAGLTGNIAGNVGMVLLPGGILKGAGAALGSRAISAAGGAIMAPQSIGGAAALGSTMGAVQPSASTGETLTNTGVGAVASAAIPAAVWAAKTLKSVAEPLYERGQQAIVGRLLNRVAGPEAPAVASRLEQAGMPFIGPTRAGEAVRGTLGEIVPGSVPTVGQAAGNAGIASVERAATAINPEMAQTIAQRLADQNAARIAHVESIVGPSGERELFDASRKTAAEKLYQDAYAAGMDLRRDAATGQFLTKAQQAGRKGEINKLLNTPAMQEAVDKARLLMRNEMVNVSDPRGSVQGLDYTRRALSDLIGEAKPGSNQARILMNLRDRLDTTLNTISPKYAEARATFAEMSKPINQMDVAQELLDRGVNKVTGKLEAGKFINALNDRTAATATGFKRATVEGTLDATAQARVNAVADDLRRSVAALNAGGGPGSDTVKKLAYSNFIDAAGVPTWIRNFAPAQIGGNLVSRGADAIYGRANTEMSARLAALMNDPAGAASVMRIAQQPGNERLMALLARSGSGAGASVPFLLNSHKK